MVATPQQQVHVQPLIMLGIVPGPQGPKLVVGASTSFDRAAVLGHLQIAIASVLQTGTPNGTDFGLSPPVDPAGITVPDPATAQRLLAG